MTIEQFQKWLQKAVDEGRLCGDDSIVVYNEFHEQYDSIDSVYAEEDSVVIQV